MAVFNNILAGASGATGAAAFQIDRSLRFNSADSAYLGRTPSSASNRRTFTFSTWVKRHKFGADQKIFGVNSAWFTFYFTSSDNLRVYYENNGSQYFTTDAVFRDPSAWYHIVLKVDTTQSTASDRVKIYVNSEELTFSATGTTSQNYEFGVNTTNAHDIGMRSSESILKADFNLADVHFIDGQALAPTNFGKYDDNNNWNPKAYSGTYNTNGFHLDFSDNSSNSALGEDSSGNNNDWTVNNLVAASTVWSDLTTPSNTSTQFPYSRGFDGVITGDGGTSGFAGWLASAGSITITFPSGTSVSNTIDIYHGDGLNGSTTASITVDGTTTTSSSSSGYVTTKSFSSVSGDLESITLTQAGGGVRFYGIAIDGTTLVDVPGSDVDSLIDTPTNYEADSGNNGGNYATLNPLDSNIGSNLTNGNLDAAGSSNWSAGHARGTFGLTSGKWYWEVTRIGGSGATAQIGFCNKAFSLTTSYGSLPADSWTFAFGNGTEILRPSGGGTGYFSGSAMGVGDIAGIALDMDNKTAVFYKNGTAGATIDLSATSTGSTDNIDELFPLVGVYNANVALNGGQRPFAYTPPTGYKSLCTQNLTDPTIADGSTAMDAVTYTGDSTNGRNVTGFNFSPDFVWVKGRSSGPATIQHVLQDTVRGTNVMLSTNEQYGESGFSSPPYWGYISSFNSDGFSLTAGAGGHAHTNNNNTPYISWAWDAGTVANPVGDIWQGSATKYIGVKFASASGGTVSYGQTSGSTTVEVWTSSDNSSWTQQGGTLTLSDGHTLTTSDQYVVIRNTTNATFTNWFAAATDGADGHYSSVTYPSGASWSGPPYTDYDWRDAGGVINEDGSIPSIVRANTSTGFSICTYTGSTGNQSFGHGLNAAPKFIAIKNRSNSAHWFVMIDIGTTYYKYGHFNTLDALADATAQPVSSTTVTLGNNNAWFGANSDNYVAYCWAPVEGYSAFGKWTGGSDAFVYLGFRPKFLLIKANASGNDWLLFDSERSTFNSVDDWLTPNSGAAETQNNPVNYLDFLSNGFKIKGTSGYFGASVDMIYVAFASHPFKTARAA